MPSPQSQRGTVGRSLLSAVHSRLPAALSSSPQLLHSKVSPRSNRMEYHALVSFLTASLTNTIAPRLPPVPGTFPFTKIRPRSLSTRMTTRLSSVRCLPPIRPAILVPGQTRPGSWCWPVAPPERCEIDTPWLAARPPKPHRFITPWYPFPTLRKSEQSSLGSAEDPNLFAVTSTYCPGTKCIADNFVPEPFRTEYQPGQK